MFKNLLYSFFFILLSVTAFAQENIKPLTANINYLKGDLQINSNKQNLNYYNKATSLTLPFKDDFFYSPYLAYPLQTLWSDSSTYVNSGFAIAPLSIGVATFDGLNKYGYPYTPNLANMTSSLPADTLTSKPINLDLLLPADSIALTFYYQARGNGDAPELTDTLLLDYFKPKQNAWDTKVWYQRGNSSPNTNDTIFKRGFTRVIDTAYLHDGFKFRFRNKATTAGDFDHWNLDYVYLDKNRNFTADTNYYDYSFGYIPTPLLKNYTSMPWRQYDTTDMADKNSVFIRNNGILNGNLTYTNNFYDKTNTKVHGYNGGAFPSLGVFKPSGWLNYTPISNPTYTYNFPLMTNGPANYKVQHILYTSSVDFSQGNDTVIQNIGFSNFYSFDDGSAEGGYYVSGVGAKIAAKYTLRVTDTLRAVRIYFDPAGSLTLAQSYAFRINVWQAGPFIPSTTVIYRDSVMNPKYYSIGFNPFTEYKLTSQLILSPGTYYIGIQQQVASGIVIGFDKNTNHASSLFYDSGNGWTQSAIYGSLMMRPIFGSELPTGIKENSLSKNDVFLIYPNPSSSYFVIRAKQSEKASYMIFNSIGQKISNGKIEDQEQIVNTENLSNGIYFLILKINDQLVQQQKIIIQH